MTVFFTADTHFGHDNIIKLCQRPFENGVEMDEALIDKWNSVVKRGDEVWHLGDFGFRADPERLRKIFYRLNGKKRLILGNHDDEATVARWDWAKPPTNYAVASVNGQKVVLFHYGLRVWEKMFRGAVHLYGHSHGRLPGTKKAADVGVDVWDFTPVTLEKVMARMSESPEHDMGEPENAADI